LAINNFIKQAAIELSVGKCPNARGQGKQAAEWEAEINDRVHRLYGLTRDEIKLVEGQIK